MKYSFIRDDIKTGDLIAISSGGWKTMHDIQVSVVRMLTQSEYSHVGIAWKVAGRIFLIEAVGSGVRIYPLSKEIPFYWIPNPKELSTEALEEALSRVGESYSKLQAVKAFFKTLKQGEDNAWQCAEFVNYIYTLDGYDLECDFTPSALVKAAIQKWSTPIYYINT
jgi:uncharacterized protein YycO